MTGMCTPDVGVDQTGSREATWRSCEADGSWGASTSHPLYGQPNPTLYYRSPCTVQSSGHRNQTLS